MTLFKIYLEMGFDSFCAFDGDGRALALREWQQNRSRPVLMRRKTGHSLNRTDD
jgi:hypothetical protein